MSHPYTTATLDRHGIRSVMHRDGPDRALVKTEDHADGGRGPGQWAGRQPGGMKARLPTGEQKGHGGPKGGPGDRQD